MRAPTLMFHAKNDTLQIYRNAEYAGRMTSGAKVVPFERGGHLVIAVELETIREQTRKHILEYAAR